MSKSDEHKTMSGDEEGKVVCVTGASGYIASWLVKFLLQNGYTVKATVRDPEDPKKIEHLLALEGAKERLHLLKADLLEEGIFDSIVDGCQGVFHTASPVILDPKDPAIELIDPAVKGTINVLKSCAKFRCIKRVVLTSSMAAVMMNGKPLAPDVVVDETWFSYPAFCLKSELWYMLSKTLAEEAATRFATENGIDLVTINPGFVIGPFLQPTLNLTVNDLLKFMNGGPTFSDQSYRYVDVRDVAYAHIHAFEISAASGRYCLVGKVTQCWETRKILHRLYPALPLPAMDVGDIKPHAPATYQVSKEKAKSLGINFTPLEVTIRDTVECLKDKGFLNI